jgi:hypothetical protein
MNLLSANRRATVQEYGLVRGCKIVHSVHLDGVTKDHGHLFQGKSPGLGRKDPKDDQKEQTCANEDQIILPTNRGESIERRPDSMLLRD